MSLSRLKLPFFLKILLISFLPTISIAIIEISLEQILLVSYPAYTIWDFLYKDSLGEFLMPFIIATGMGGVSIYIGGKQPLKTIFDTSSLWLLVACLYLGIFVKSLLNIPTLIIGFEYNQTAPILLGIVAGVFLAGEKYWNKNQQ
jgi:hypothetical protein